MTTALMTHEVDGTPQFAPDFDDEIVAGCCVTRAGAIVHAPTRERVEGTTATEGGEQL